MTELAPQENGGAAALMERVLIAGDLAKLSAQDRVRYYTAVCDSVGLNPLTRPLEYITLNGKLTLYARKDATDQLRKLHKVNIIEVRPERIGDLYVVTARAQTPDGRADSEIGAVNVAGLKGEALANMMMKATTKAKRRVTLCLCGLGLLDETEVESIPAERRDPPPDFRQPGASTEDEPMADDDEFRTALMDAFAVQKFSPEQSDAATAAVLEKHQVTSITDLPLDTRRSFIAAVASGKLNKFKTTPETAGASA